MYLFIINKLVQLLPWSGTFYLPYLGVLLEKGAMFLLPQPHNEL
jgi:uncharacterized membrane protein YqaE (UPF0057 family)